MNTESATNLSQKPTRVLLVEDDPDFSRMLKNLLKTSGFEVSLAYSGEEGLKLARMEGPDLILLDLMLPRMDAFAVTRLLKLDHRYRHIPVVIMTARRLIGDYRRSMQAGADAYLTKPFSPQDLMGIINGLLKAKDGSDPARGMVDSSPNWMDGSKLVGGS